MQVALVEPSRTVCRIVTDMITAWDHEVRSCTDGEEALSYLRTHHDVRALITSAELRAISGLQLCAEARALAGSDRPIYIILMSSNDERAKLVQALDNGADDFISKPPAPEELRARLRAAERLTSMQAELIRAATTDSLTGLLSRRAFFKSAEAVWKNETAPLSTFICDLDKFKLVNDTHGHEIGDLVLRMFSAEAKEVGVPVGRLGGEEFAFLIEAGLEDAFEIADRFRQAIARLVIPMGSAKIGITCSIGVAEREPGDTIDTLLRRADISLYEAKRLGRDRVVVADSFSSTKDHDSWRGVARLSAR